MKTEGILCLPQRGKVPSLSRRMRCSAAYAAGCRAKKKSRKRLFFALRRRHSPTHPGAAMSRFAEGCGFGCGLCGSLPPPYFHTARRAAAQRKRAASGSFLLCAEGTARPISALRCPALPRAADSAQPVLARIREASETRRTADAGRRRPYGRRVRRRGATQYRDAYRIRAYSPKYAARIRGSFSRSSALPSITILPVSST